MSRVFDTQCPYCLRYINVSRSEHLIGKDIDGIWWSIDYNCTSCGKKVIRLIRLNKTSDGVSPILNPGHCQIDVLSYPKGINRSPIPIEVPSKYADDYKEACLVLSDSPKASAALSRRCLQTLIEDEYNIPNSSLNQEINTLVSQNILPSEISDLLHSLQWVGNFAAHPQKDSNTRSIIDVEVGEAELCLEIIESLFDFKFVSPARNAMRKAAIQQKLIAAGKSNIVL
jgi:hypothetical protein